MLDYYGVEYDDNFGGENLDSPTDLLLKMVCLTVVSPTMSVCLMSTCLTHDR